MAIDPRTIRPQLTEFKKRLARLDEERGAIQAIIRGFEVLLRADEPEYTSRVVSVGGGSPASFSITSVVDPEAGPHTITQNTVSMRSAVVRILREANGPIRSQDILARARQLGADTNAKNPVSVIDLYIRRLIADGRVEKVAPRTWRWIGD